MRLARSLTAHLVSALRIDRVLRRGRAQGGGSLKAKRARTHLRTYLRSARGVRGSFAARLVVVRASLVVVPARTPHRVGWSFGHRDTAAPCPQPVPGLKWQPASAPWSGQSTDLSCRGVAAFSCTGSVGG